MRLFFLHQSITGTQVPLRNDFVKVQPDLTKNRNPIINRAVRIRTQKIHRFANLLIDFAQFSGNFFAEFKKFAKKIEIFENLVDFGLFLG